MEGLMALIFILHMLMVVLLIVYRKSTAFKYVVILYIILYVVMNLVIANMLQNSSVCTAPIHTIPTITIQEKLEV